MKGVKFYPKKALIPCPIVKGARMWCVSFAQNISVNAVDAWSPVMGKYRQEKNDHNVLEIERILAGCMGMKP